MPRRRFRWGIREKLTLLFFGVTLVAVTVNFMIVVPRLELRMRNDRISTLERSAQRIDPLVQAVFHEYDENLVSPVIGGVWTENLQTVVASTGERIAVLRRAPPTVSPLGPVDRFQVVWDITGETPADGSTLIDDPIAAQAVRSGQIARGLSTFGSGLHAEVAVPLINQRHEAVGAVAWTTPLSGVTQTVRQVARRQVFSGMIALAIALIAGLLASSYMARRLRRLEDAARAVAKGNFREPLVVDSDDEIGEVTRAFNQMQDRLGRADQARKAFIANASHELRTPLFSLGGYVELMREEELDAETQREFLDQMHRQITRMTKLATDLLDLSKIDTESLAIQPQQVDLEGLAQSVKREFDPQALQHESTITVEAAEDCEAICDPDRVAQIVRILIDNALSHTPTGTAVGVRVDADREGVLLRVSDDGPGIPEDELPQIFNRFHTGDKTGGTGLGLAIGRDLAAAMNGSLDVASDGGGTTFTLRLPAGVRVRRTD